MPRLVTSGELISFDLKSEFADECDDSSSIELINPGRSSRLSTILIINNERMHYNYNK